MRFIRNAANLGFAAGCNVGIAAARDLGAVHVVLLNNDTIVSPGFAEPLVEALERDPRAGVAGGTILHWDGAATDRVWYAVAASRSGGAESCAPDTVSASDPRTTRQPSLPGS